jgi:hypothetical protein
MSNMRNLTLASAKHLLTQGHITPAHHAQIVDAVRPKKIKQPATRVFGSLAQQAQAPIPAIMPGGMAQIPAGTSSGYDDGQ